MKEACVGSRMLYIEVGQAQRDNQKCSTSKILPVRLSNQPPLLQLDPQQSW